MNQRSAFLTKIFDRKLHKISSIILFGSLILSLNYCASTSDSDFNSLLEQQPKLLKIYPEPESAIEENTEFLLEFSERLSIKSIHEHSISLLKGPIDPVFFKNTKELMEALEDQELSLIPCQYFLAANERELSVSANEDLSEGLYYLMVTPYLRSANELPFNQTPGNSPTAFLAAYGLGAGVALLPSITENGFPEESEPSYGVKPTFLVINELLYDGKVSDTDGESFIELYGTPGGDISDYFISFINGSDGAETDLITLPQGSQLDGTGLFVIADLHTNSQSTTQVLAYNYLDQFDPQNGPDAVHIFDRDGQLLDALWYGEGSISHTLSGLTLGEGNPALDVGGGESLSRSMGVDTNNNSIDFSGRTQPSPRVL